MNSRTAPSSEVIRAFLPKDKSVLILMDDADYMEEIESRA